MTKNDLAKSILRELKDLPVESLKEILDFIQFLKSKKYKRKKSFEKKIQTELDNLNKNSLIHLEEEFSNYREQYPRE